jgi:hypothetical protein
MVACHICAKSSLALVPLTISGLVPISGHPLQPGLTLHSCYHQTICLLFQTNTYLVRPASYLCLLYISYHPLVTFSGLRSADVSLLDT